MYKQHIYDKGTIQIINSVKSQILE